MDPALNRGPDGIDLADSRIILQDGNVDPEPGNRKEKELSAQSSDCRGWRKLVRNFTPS